MDNMAGQELIVVTNEGVSHPLRPDFGSQQNADSSTKALSASLFPSSLWDLPFRELPFGTQISKRKSKRDDPIGMILRGKIPIIGLRSEIRLFGSLRQGQRRGHQHGRGDPRHRGGRY